MIEDKIEHDDVTYIIWIGKNAQENWDIITKASQNDIWFHLEDFSSPHVILRVEDTKLKVVPKILINKCASLCKQHSKYNKINKISIIYTEIKNVKKGDKVGSVMTQKTKSLIC